MLDSRCATNDSVRREISLATPLKMAISDTDIKKLWGLAAGRCASPGCNLDCIQFLDPKDPTVIGEMAHVIAKKPHGPRGRPAGGLDTYENLILLCPTHHRTVDKAPEGKFPEAMLHQWKKDHEARIASLLRGVKFSTKEACCDAITRLLIENHEARGGRNRGQVL